MAGELELDPTLLGGFRDAFAGEIVVPGDPGYEDARTVWNGMIDRRPAIVVRPTGAEDVISAVRFARAQGLVIAVRSGGHSIPGLSTCDGGIVIDLSRMRGVTVDPGRRIARVNGGALLAELDQEAQRFGLACPVGVVAHTGVAGLTLGGGMGRLQRKFGLTIDSLVSVDLVTADGRLVHASEDENADLFWGMRGAGANFGIVTAFEFRLHPLGPTVTNGFVLHPAEKAPELAQVFRAFVDSSPDEVTTTFGLGLAEKGDAYPTGSPVAWISALHCGDVTRAERDLAPIRAFGSPGMDTFAAVPYLTAQHANDDSMDWGHRFYMKSAFAPAIPDEMVGRCLDAISNAPPGDCSITMWAWGRAIGTVPDEATAFTGRDAAFWVSAETLWDHPDRDPAHVEWGRGAMAAVQPLSMAGHYVNDVAETGDDALVRSIYGDGKYERLVALKRAWDPENVFRLNQNVKP